MVDSTGVNRWITIWGTFFSALLFGIGTKAATPRGSVQEIACALTNQNVAAALIDNAVWITLDGGIRWKQTARFAQENRFTGMEPEPKRPLEASESSFSIRPHQRRPNWEIPVEDPDIEITGIVPDPIHRYLAVGDNGTWALALGESLIIGDPLAGVRRRIKLADIRGLLFDRKGRLWVTVENGVIFFGKAANSFKGRKRFNLPGAGEPVRSTQTDEMLVPGRAGLWVVSLNGNGKEALIGPFPLSTIDAIAVLPGRNLLYAISLRRLKRLSLVPSDDPTCRGLSNRARCLVLVQDICPTPAPVRRLQVDRTGRIHIFTGRSGWFERSGNSWRPLRVRALAVDAIGRLWSGTDHGPIAPSPETAATPDETPLVPRFANLLHAAISDVYRWPGAPRCRKIHLRPLPALRGFFSVGRRASLHREIAIPPVGAHHQTQFHIGVQFTWRFDPLTQWRCIPHHVRFHALKQQRIQETEALWKSLQRTSKQRESATNVLQAAVHHLDRQQLQELLRIKSGTLPNEEEK
ncbi:MAG: hypothetical protein GY762_07680 [Proteobacteria bacterium]|nr:hypothetical protein [Pseudomonadota bacterium]